MIAAGFVVAMRVVAVQGPGLPGLAMPEWLIVARWGERGGCLSVADGVAVARRHNAGPGDAAPASLHPRATWFGTLAGETAAEGAIFLLAREAPHDLLLAGNFRPAEGYARLQGGADGALSLALLARGLPRPDGSVRTWHLAAAQRPWLGTCVDGTSSATRRAGECFDTRSNPV